MNEIIKIEKIVFGGQGMGRLPNGKKVFVFGVLPEEEVKIEIIKNKKDFALAEAKEIIQPSPFRKQPLEDHFLSCSPFQIIDFDYENQLKKEIIKEVFEKNAGEKLPDFEIVAGKKQVAYRNKMEFSFIPDPLSLAFHKRNSRELVPIQGCILAVPIINSAARGILKTIESSNIPKESLKSLVLKSNSKGEVLGGLFITEVISDLPDFLTSHPDLVGFGVYYSKKETPASVVHQVIKEEGKKYFEENILENKFFISLLSFSQVNLEVFEKALSRIKQMVNKDDKVIDFYSGVGTIGLSLSVKNITLVEIDEESIKLAVKNNDLNQKNAKIILSPSEKVIDLLKTNIVAIFDPPRAGLHPKIIKKIRSVQPRKIIYLSCNPSTQARDFSLLKDIYKIKFFEAYNFFPRTPHIESLMVLEK